MTDPKKNRKDQMVERLNERFKRLQIKDPVVVVFALIAIAALYFFLFPSKKRVVEDPFEGFEARKEVFSEQEQEKTEAAKERTQNKFDQSGRVFQSEKAYREEIRKRERAEKKAREYEERLISQQEGFPKRKLREEYIARSYYAPIGKGSELPVRMDSRPQPQRLRTTPVSTELAGRLAPNVETPKHELRAGTWIPAILNGDMHSQVGGSQRATIREDVFDSEGQYVLIPKGSTAIVQFAQSAQGDAYHVSALSVKEIIYPNGDVKTLPIPVHDSLGKAGLDPRKDGKYKRHYLEKIGMSVMIAGISSLPALMVDGDKSNDLAEYQFINTTSQGVQSILRDSLSIPNEKIFHAGAHLNFFMLDSILMEAYEEVHYEPQLEQAKLRQELENLKGRMFQAKELGRKADQTLDELTPEKIRRRLQELTQIEERIYADYMDSEYSRSDQ